MNLNIFYGILIPFLGTSIGAACVFFMKNTLSDKIQRALTGFAAGVMVAASVWSLIIPAIEQSASMGKLSFLPAAIGFWIGILFLLLLDHIIPHLHQNSDQAEGPKSKLQRTTMMVLAVTLHNIPEGMAVGVVYAGYLSDSSTITAAGAVPLLHVGGSASALKDDPSHTAEVLAAAVESGGYEGLFLDLAELSSAQKKDFTALAEALRAELGEDRLLYLMVEAPVWQGAAYNGYDYANYCAGVRPGFAA